MGFAIQGIGTASPNCKIQQSDAALLAQSFTDQSSPKSLKVLQKLYQRTGVQTRHSVLLNSSSNGTAADQSFYPVADGESDRGPTTATRMRAYETHAGQLAIGACGRALENARTLPSQITHLITVSCSGFAAPGVDIQLIEALRLPSQVARTHIGFMGCHGAINGMRVARSLAESDPNATILLCAVELCSLHYQYGGAPDQMVANALFSDGAAAIVGGNSSVVEADQMISQIVDNGSNIIPGTGDLMSWSIGDHGFRMTLSPQVPETIREHLAPWMIQWLGKNSLTPIDINGWCVHPGGPRILQATEDSLQLSQDALATSRGILSRFGNMSSPTVLFVLDEMLRNGIKPPIVLLGFGPGLAIEAALLKA